MLSITVNGKSREIEGSCTILEFLQAHNVNPLLVAVEHNGEIIRREQFGAHTLHPADTLEIIQMVGGGAE